MPTDPLGLVEQTLLGRYHVEAPIAQGGMGVVYRGSDLRLLRPVCIKIFHRFSSNDQVHRASYDHFVQEAFALSRLSHPHTLRIYDFGHLAENDGRAPFHVCELLDGGTLGQWIRAAGPRPPLEALELIGPIAGALSEAHSRGIIHRDVKPSNIILGVMGSRRIAKLGDFGIAKTESELSPAGLCTQDAAGRPAMRLYSVGWAAPEQLRGEPAVPATDVFALGLVTAFVLGGRPIFGSRSEDAVVAEADCDAHVARKLAELALPAALADVVQTACRGPASERYASAEQFATALSDAVLGLTTRNTSGAPASGVSDLDEAPSGVTCSLLLPADELETDSPLLLPSDEQRPTFTASHLTAPGSALARAHRRKRPRARDAELHVDCTGERELSMLGRKLTLLRVQGDGPLDLGGPQTALSSRARFRITLLPSALPSTRINVKGLNCFIARPAGRPAAAVNLDDDTELELLAEDRQRLEGVACSLGRSDGDQQLHQVGSLILAVAGAAAGAVLLDLGPGREFVLIHRAAPALRLGGCP